MLMIKLVLETTDKFSRPWPPTGTHDIPDERVMEEGRMIGSGEQEIGVVVVHIHRPPDPRT